MSQKLLFVLTCLLGLAAGRTNINCSLEYDDSLPMQQQLQGQELVVPFDIDPPFSYQTDDGRFSGFSYDVLQAIAVRGNFSVSVISAGQATDNETNDKALDDIIATADFVGSYWSDTPSRRANRVMISLHYVDVTRYLVTLPDQIKPEDILDNMFAFLRPFSAQLWIVIVFGIIFSAAVTYALEMSSLCGRRGMMTQELAKELEGKRWKVYWGFIHRSFSHFTMTGDSIEAKSVMGQVHNVVWAFVVMVLLAAYTANLAGTLVVKKAEYIEFPTIAAIKGAELGLCVSASDQYILDYIENKHPGVGIYSPPHNETRSRDVEVAEALLEGKCTGAILTDSAYQILRTNVTFCELMQREQVGPTLGGGFAFPIDRCGTYYMGVINSILTGMRADRSLDDMWVKEVKQVSCPIKPVQAVVAKAQGMRFGDFSGLFILYLCWIGCTVALRIFEQTYSGMTIAAEKVKVRVSRQRSQMNNEDGSNPRYSTASTPRFSTTSNQSESPDEGADSLDAKVTDVESTVSHIIATLRDLNIPTPTAAGQTHKRVQSKQANLDTPKASPQSTNKRLSKTLVPTLISSEEKKSSEPTKRPSQSKANDPASSGSGPSPTQIPEPTTSQTPTSQAPEPTTVQAPEPTVAQTPEPTVAQTPEPTVAQIPEPAVAQIPELAVAQIPEPVAPEPSVAQTPEPAVAQSPEPTTENHSMAPGDELPESSQTLSSPVPEPSPEPLKTSGPEHNPENLPVLVAELNEPSQNAGLDQTSSNELDEKSGFTKDVVEIQAGALESTLDTNLTPLDIPEPKTPGRLSTAVFIPFGPPSPRLQGGASVEEKAVESAPTSASSVEVAIPGPTGVSGVDAQKAIVNEPLLDSSTTLEPPLTSAGVDAQEMNDPQMSVGD